ncbi:hypothetical protein ACFQ0G_05050 [Streptomyces chiangmaiensis]
MDVPHHALPAGDARLHRHRNRTVAGRRGTLAWTARDFPARHRRHSTQQDFYFGPDHLLRRHDYHVDIAGGFAAAQYVYDTVEADGIRLPTKRRAYRRDADRRPILGQTMVSIDVSNLRFT